MPNPRVQEHLAAILGSRDDWLHWNAASCRGQTARCLQGGVISIRATAISLDSGEWIELRIVDSGVGMSPNTVARTFDPFFTTKYVGLGGVGLHMVERFVLEVRGHVLIESEYGVGTAVRLQLPVSLQSTDSSLAPGYK